MKKTLFVAILLLMFVAIPVAYATNENEVITEPEPLNPDMVKGVVFLLYFIGIIVKAFVPYYRKYGKNSTNFDIRYLWVAIINIFALLGQATGTFGEFPLPVVYDGKALALLAFAALIVGAGLTWFTDEAFKWFKFMQPQETEKPAE